MSAKELGMIHVANFTTRVNDGDTTSTLLDLSGTLTEQLQRLIRQGQYFKIVGIDMAVHGVGAVQAGTVSGLLRYFAPTSGRCEAYRAAFKAMAEAMKLKGISMRDNRFYDFKLSTRDSTVLTNSLANCASFDGISELSLNAAVPNGIFQVHNFGVEPQEATTSFNPGFDVFGSAGNDFVVNEGQQGYTGTDGLIADVEFEEIPFTVAFDVDGTSGGNLLLQWRPDPALYLAVLTGQFEITLDSTTTIPPAGVLDIETTIMVSGWKSIMGKKKAKQLRR